MRIAGLSGRRLWVLAAIPLLPALAVGFLLDDYLGLLVLRREGWLWLLGQLHPGEGEFLRPLGLVLFQIEHAVFGLRPVAFHALHLGLFALAGWMTGRLAERLAGRRGIAPWAAALALLYPGRVAAYAWLAAVFDLLALLAVLGLLHAALSAREKGGAGRLVLLGVGAALAPFTKESAYAALPVLVLWEAIPGLLPPTREDTPRGRRWAVIGAVAAGFGLAALYRLEALGGVGGYRGTGLRAVADGLAALPRLLLTAVPGSVNPGVDLGPDAGTLVLRGAVGAVGLGALALAAVRARRSIAARRLLVGGFALALGGLAPVLPYIRATAPWTASRLLTLFGAGVALALAAASLSPEPAGRSVAGRAVGGALVVAWALATLVNLQPWLDAARGRDAILDAIAADTAGPGLHQVWIEGPINDVDGAHMLGGALEAAVRVHFPERRIRADSAFFQRYRGAPVGPPEPAPGASLHLYRFDPKTLTVDRLSPGWAGRRP